MQLHAWGWLWIVACAGCGHAAHTDVHVDGAAAGTIDAAPPPGPPPRESIDLDPAWRFLREDVAGASAVDFDDRAWSPVALPHTWNAIDGQGNDAYYRGVGWYRRHLRVDPMYAGRRLVLEFDGADLVTDVYVNGHAQGQHRGGYSRFRFDVTADLRVDADNVIAVKVDNTSVPDVAPLDADYTFFGGLYRDARLLITYPLHVSTADHGGPGVVVRTTTLDAASAELAITAQVQNDGAADASVRVGAQILDDSGAVVVERTATQTIGAGAAADVLQTATVSSPHRWSGRRDPYLYTVVVRVTDAATGKVTDEVRQPLGLRTCAVDAATGFALNGEHLALHGVNVHQDRQDVGWALTAAQLDQDVGIMEELGVTAVRASHYAHADRFYDLTDRDGIIVWAEIPLIDRITDSPAFTANAKAQLVELIRQNQHHPSICFWSVANEVTLEDGPSPVALEHALGALAHAEDPTRISTLASMDVAGDRGHTDAIGFNKYFGWYTGGPTDFAPWADHVHATEPGLPMAISEYGAGASIHFHADAPKALDHTEEYQARFHETHWRAIKTRPYLWGTFVWNLFDFASSTRNEGDTPGRNDKGLVTYDRATRKDAFYFYKANWTDTPFVYITSRRFTPRTQATIDVRVYGTMAKVELKVGGVSLGSKSGTDGVYTWTRVKLSKGTNEVEAIGTTGATVVTDHVTWQL